METDKRNHPRFSVRLKLRYRAGEERWRPAFTKEISTGGLYILTAHIPTAPKAEVEVTTELGMIPLVGRVLRGDKVPPRLRRIKPGGIAIALYEPPELWHRLCLDLEEKSRDRGAKAPARFVSASTEVSDPADE